jgi:cell fate regulator YaaT (PSP1 superfamily)
MKNPEQNTATTAPSSAPMPAATDNSIAPPRQEKDLLGEIKLDTGMKYFAILPSSINLKIKDWCVVRKDKILDYGQLVKILDSSFLTKLKLSPDEILPRIEHKATMQDQSRANENIMRAKSAVRTAIQYIHNLNLPMKLMNAHYSLDMKLVTFQFSSPGRVDFRELVKQLSHGLNTKIELRQIGVRDETALFGGFGVCGQVLCCNRYIREFDSITVRMAKEQDLPLNPCGISGVCGRLKCCLKYEHKGYLELEKGIPRRGFACDCAEGRGKIVDRNLLTRKVSVQLDETGKTISCSADEVRIVYLEKYKVPAETSTDIFDDLDADAAKELKKLEDN